MQQLLYLIEDDSVLGASITAHLRGIGYTLTWFRSAAEVETAMKLEQRPEAVISDIRLPDANGEDLFCRLRNRWPDTAFIFMTGYGSIEQAVRLVKEGADDYLSKPFEVGDLVTRISTLLDRRAMEKHGRLMLDDLRQRMQAGKGDTLGFSPQMREIERMIAKVRNVASTVLITGETGTGKELVAALLHHTGPRSERPFVKINCGGLPPSLLDSELFGYEKGAFTGANQRKTGKVEQAHGGTLFLDEIGDAPADVQVKLLRVLQEREVERLGGVATIPVDIRLIVATHRDLAANVAAGTFREDFYYRINVVRIDIPPLRQRRQDILYLAHYFLQFFLRQFELPPKRFSPQAEAALVAHDFPGNVRELRNIIERAVVMADREVLAPSDLFPATPAGLFEDDSAQMKSVVAVAERTLILRVLRENRESIGGAASAMGISRKTLWEKMVRYGIDRGPRHGPGSSDR